MVRVSVYNIKMISTATSWYQYSIYNSFYSVKGKRLASKGEHLLKACISNTEQGENQNVLEN